MSRYIPYIIGQYPEIDNIVTKVIINMGLELGEVSISKLEPSKYSGSNNIGIFLLNVEKSNNKYTGQWILKMESVKFDDEDRDQDDNVPSNNISCLWWEEKGVRVCNYQQNKNHSLLDIQEINDLQNRLNFLKKSKVIQDIVIIPIAIGEEINDKASLAYSLQKKADGRTLFDIQQSHTSKLTRPSFWEFDSYESYAAEIEARFEEPGAAMSTSEVKYAYYRTGQSLAKLHFSGILQKPNGELSFSTSFLHGDFHGTNIFISAYTVQFIDNDSIISYTEDVEGCPIDQDLISMVQYLLFHNLNGTPNDMRNYLESFFKGYISIYNDKVTIAEYLKSWIETYDFYQRSGEVIDFSLSSAKDLIDQLPNIIDSIIAEETGNNNSIVENLPGDVANEAIVHE